jgi:hypothetical protein
LEFCGFAHALLSAFCWKEIALMAFWKQAYDGWEGGSTILLLDDNEIYHYRKGITWQADTGRTK